MRQPTFHHMQSLQAQKHVLLAVQDVVVDFSSRLRDAERGSAEAMEQSMRETKIIDFLKFHDSVPLPPASQARSLQRGDPLFAAPQTLRTSASLSSASPPPEEVDSPSASRYYHPVTLNLPGAYACTSLDMG